MQRNAFDDFSGVLTAKRLWYNPSLPGISPVVSLKPKNYEPRKYTFKNQSLPNLRHAFK